eukprot:TRINITY_DN3085_c0_g2_i2.p1 TRINITY_DN3085_c0_g2~~TRINITY_DN3085_c0_g2_i2.p1  ORF type:complete len:326 (-),score=71.01 TRINITY_DN3085_c0_g2_i2:736-1713(-)
MESTRSASPHLSASGKLSASKSRPGGIGSQKVNFRPDERAFPPEDVPAKALEAKKDVLSYLQTDVLGISKPRWNPSSETGLKFPDPAFKRELHQFSSINPEHNYRAEKVLKEPLRPMPKGNKFKFDQRLFLEPETRDQIVNMNLSTRPMTIPVHPDLVDAKPWNPSTTTLTKKEKDMLLTNETSKSTRNSNKSMMTLKSYATPTEQISQLIEEQRARKKEEFAVQDRLETLYGREGLDPEQMKSIESEKRQIEELRRMRLEASKRMEVTRGPPRKTKIYAHTGAWQFNPLEKSYSWSCCMSSLKESKGCTLSRVINQDSWNTDSF